MKNLLTFLFFTICVIPVTAQERIAITDMLKIKRVGAVSLSPDGSKVIYAVQEIVPKKDSNLDYSFTSQLWLSEVSDGSTARQLTFSESGTSQASFSPDGQSILFVRSVDRKPQLFLLPLSGGEPIQLTNHKYGASNPKWSKDGTKILFSASLSIPELLKDSVLNPGGELPTWNAEKPGFPKNEHLAKSDAKANPDGSLEEIRAYLAKNQVDNKAKVITKLNFQGETSTSSDMRFSHLFIVDAWVGAEVKPITKGFHSFGQASFIDSNSILVGMRDDDEIHPDRVQEGKIYRIDIATGVRTQLFGAEGRSFSVADVSPSGEFLAYQESEVGRPSVAKLYIVPLAQPDALPVYVEYDRSKGSFTWSADGKYLYFTAQANGGTILARATVNNGRVEELSSKDEGISSYAIENGKIVFAKNNTANPSELYVSNDLILSNVTQLTSVNVDWLKNKTLSIPEKATFINDEGMEVEYWVMKPIGFREGSSYPLLLQIHGGPSAMWGPGEASMWHEYQYFCAQGYGIVYANPRGSGGYGEEFLRANVNNWGAGPASDVLTALDKAVAQGWADTSKLLVSGGSYAGYLTSWIISHDQRFAAASSQRGVYDLKTFFGEGNAWRLVPNYFGGYPWEKEVGPVLERESPINYVENIHTPYIIFHGEVDLRTGVIQSEMLYKSLKILGRPVEYVRHPGASHEITRSGDNRQRIDQMLRTYEFFERYIR